MVKMRVEVQQLQPGDIVLGSQEIIHSVIVKSIKWPSNKCQVRMVEGRTCFWGRYTMINIDRPSSNIVTGFQVHEPKSWNGISHK